METVETINKEINKQPRHLARIQLFVLFWRQGLCRPGKTHDPSASAFRVLESQLSITMPSLKIQPFQERVRNVFFLQR